MSTSAPQTPPATYPGLALLSAATLLLEIALTRVLSASLWYHFAFMVVSTALFGLGFAGVFLALRKRAEIVTTRLIAIAAVGTPIAFTLGYWLYNVVPFEPFSLGEDSRQWLYLPLCYLAVTLPFFFSGLTIAAVLTRHASKVHRLYLYDLVGAGLGSLAVIALLPLLGGSGTILAAAVVAALAAALLANEHERRYAIAALVIAALLAAATPLADSLIPVRISSNKRSDQILADADRVIDTRWNTMSRVDLIKHGRQLSERVILIDAGTALTRLAHPGAPLDRLSPTATEEGFFLDLFTEPNVLVVGSGGGREVLVALRNGAGKITGVEINPAINQMVRDMADYTGDLYNHPRVNIFTDEARSFLRRSSDRYDIIWCPHTISNAALASGSLSLAENHLLTIEAFADYLAHLGDDGILLITRPEAHLPRLFSTIRAAFAAAGRDQITTSIVAWRERQRNQPLAFKAGVAVRMRPFTGDEVTALVNRMSHLRIEPLYVPNDVGAAPYHDILTAADLDDVELPFASILTPATDDKPFFNQRVAFTDVGWSDLAALFSQGKRGRAAIEERPIAEASLLLLLIEAILLALVFIVLPLLVFRRRALAGAGRVQTLLCFTALGLGFIVVEIGFIQRFTLYLGRPVIVFSTVLGTLLVLSGLGSAFAARFKGDGVAWRACAAAAVVVLVTALLTPIVVQASLAWPGWLRILATGLMLAPAGFVMGMPFPLLVRQLEASYPERIPWAWGVNGFASVAGSIGAVILGMTIGFTGVLVCGVVAYVAAAIAAAQVPTE